MKSILSCLALASCKQSINGKAAQASDLPSFQLYFLIKVLYLNSGYNYQIFMQPIARSLPSKHGFASLGLITLPLLVVCTLGDLSAVTKTIYNSH